MFDHYFYDFVEEVNGSLKLLLNSTYKALKVK